MGVISKQLELGATAYSLGRCESSTAHPRGRIQGADSLQLTHSAFRSGEVVSLGSKLNSDLLVTSGRSAPVKAPVVQSHLVTERPSHGDGKRRAPTRSEGPAGRDQQRSLSANFLFNWINPLRNKAPERVESVQAVMVDNGSVKAGQLEDGGLVFREKFVIRCYEVGVNRTASVETMANLLQEVACNHAQSVGFSNDGFATTPEMRKRHLIWVTTRMHIQMSQYPQWGQAVEIDTWFQSESNITTRRDWVIRLDSTKEVVGRGTSTWVMMNEDTRRFSKIPDEVRAEYERHCPNPPRYAMPKLVAQKVPKLEEPMEFVRSNLMPRRNDLDMNQHVNNVTYIGWMMESIPVGVMETSELEELVLEYRHECGQGDVVESLAHQLELQKPEEGWAGVSGTKVNGAAVINGNGAAVINGNGAAHSVGSKGALALSADVGGFDVAMQGEATEFVHLLRLQGPQDNGNGRAATRSVELNRGRTVWRRKGTCVLPTERISGERRPPS